jgi:hypothetical protein
MNLAEVEKALTHDPLTVGDLEMIDKAVRWLLNKERTPKESAFLQRIKALLLKAAGKKERQKHLRPV